MKLKFVIATIGMALTVLVALYWVKEGKRPRPETVPQSVSAHSQPVRQEEMTSAASAVTRSALADPILEQVPASVRPIVDLQHDAWERQRMVRTLPATLGEEELDALVAFLQERHEEDENQIGHVLKNDLMDALCAQTRLPKDLDNLFATIYRDRQQHIVIRDYAVQHLALLFERLDDPTTLAAAGTTKKEVEGVLWEAVAETDSSIAGTALLALARLSQNEKSLDRGRIGSTALRLAQDEAASELTRITALQVCARMQNAEALPILVQTAKSGATVSLQISAIGSLGLLAGLAEVDVLTQIANGKDPRLTSVANVALQRAQKRLQTP